MPRAKRQKTGTNTDETTKDGSPESSTVHKNDNERDTSTIPPFEYVCIHRPYFDYEAELAKRSDDTSEDEDEDKDDDKDKDDEDPDDEDEDEDEPDDKLRKLVKKGFQVEKEILLQPAAEHNHKWVMMWEAWKKFDVMQRRAKYCDPDNFRMYIYNDFHGYGLQEIMEQQMVAFDKALKKKDESSLNETWTLISSLGFWFNDADLGAFFGNEDGEKVKALTGLAGCALLTALSAVEHADELKVDTKFRDLGLCISNWLYFSKDLPEYGIDGDSVFWRLHAAAYFNKAGFTDKDGMANTAELLKKLDSSEDEDDEDEFKRKRSKKDTWAWAARLKAYKADHGMSTGKSKYDITKMSKKERASHAFDGKDPLADVPESALREGLLDFV